MTPVTLMVLMLVGAAIGAARLLTAAPQVDGYLSSRDADVAHLVMNLGMALMASVWFTATAQTVLIVVFCALAAAFAARLVIGAARPTVARRSRRAAEVYHLVAAVAMVVATLLMPAGHVHGAPAPTAGGMPGMGGVHGGHGADLPVAAPDAGTGGVWTVLAMLLAVLFALDALLTAVTVLAAPDRVVVESARRTPAAVGAVRSRTSGIDAADGTSAAGSFSGHAASCARGVSGPTARRSVRVAAVPHVIMGLGMAWMLWMI